MKLLGGRPTEPRWLYAVAGIAMLAGPVWHNLYVHHYPFPRIEAFLLPAAAAVLGMALGAAAHRAGGVIGGMLFAALLLAFVDLQFDLQRYVAGAVIAVGCVVASLVLRERRAAVLALALGAFYGVSLVRRPIAPPLPAAGAAIREGLAPHSLPPLLVHVILDEQWGVGGLRAEGDTATADFLTEFYLDRGFEIYDEAYSRYQNTVESVPAIMALGETPDLSSEPAEPYWASLHTNPYFARLRGLGYSINVFQSTYIDYCRSIDAPVVSCHVVSGNSIANIGYLDGPWTTRAMRAVRFFLNTTSRAYAKIVTDPMVARRSMTGGGLASAAALRDAIAAGPGAGVAYFAHLVLPHRPVDVDSDCHALRDPADRVYGEYSPATIAEGPWRRVLTLAGGQIRCAHRVLDGILSTVDERAGRDGAIVIVHGDHGSRFFDVKPARELSQLNLRQLNSLFPTLLAIRRPGVPAAIHHGAVPVQDYFWSLARHGFVGEVNGAWQPFLRTAQSDANPADTLRTLSPGDMLWVHRTAPHTQ